MQQCEEKYCTALSTNAKVSKVECVDPYGPSTTCDNLGYIGYRNPGLGFWESGSAVGSIKVTFASAASTEWEFTRWDAWDSSCGVRLLHNGNVVGSVPEGKGEKTGDRQKVPLNVEQGSEVELFEGATSSGSSDYRTCGAIVYKVKICPKI